MRFGEMTRVGVFASLLSLLAFGSSAFAQTSGGPSPHINSALPRTKVAGYLQGREPDFLDILPPYPAFDSMQDKTDVAMLRQWQQPDDSPRWKLANADVKMSYDRFAPAFGAEISPASTPLLIHLLDRVE